MTKKFWAKSPRKSYALETPISARGKSGDSFSAVGTPSKKKRGIRVILGCRNNARLQEDSSDRCPQTEVELDDVHKLPIEYPHTDLSMSHSGSYSASSSNEKSVSNADKECTIESMVLTCIQSLKDYISTITSPDWLSSDILLSSMEKVNVLTSCLTGCRPSMAFGDTRTVHSDSSVIVDSKGTSSITGASRVRSWPLTSSDVYFKTAAQDQAEELKRIRAKFEDERQQHEILSILIDDLKKEIIRMSKKESELNQANAQAAVKIRLMKEKLKFQLINQQDQQQIMEGRWHAESKQVVELKSKISRLSAEIIAATAKMRAIEDKVRQTTEANEVVLLDNAEQLTSECQKNSTLQAEINDLKAQISNAKSKSNMAPRLIAETPSVELEGVEYDFVAFNAISIQKVTKGDDDALIKRPDVLNTMVQEVVMPSSYAETRANADPSVELEGMEYDLVAFNAISIEKVTKGDDDALIETPDVLNTMVQEVVMPSSYPEERANAEETKSSDSHSTSSESGINSLEMKRNPPGWFLHLTHEPDDKSQSTNGSSIPIGCLRPNIWCIVTNNDLTTVDDSQIASHDGIDDKLGYSTSCSRSFDSSESESTGKNPSKCKGNKGIGTNNDLTTVDDSRIASHDGIDDKLGYSTSCSRSFDSTTGEKIMKHPSLSSDSSSTQSSDSEVMELPLTSYSSDVSESAEKNLSTGKGNKRSMIWFRNMKGAGLKNDNSVILKRDRTMRGRILVQ